MGLARIATFLNWRADPFVLVEQARTTAAVMRWVQVEAVVGAVDVSSLGVSSVEALMSQGVRPGLAAGARLERAVTGGCPEPRPCISTNLPRGQAEARYHRSPRDPEALDLGLQRTVRIPRDGGVDFKDADIWCVADDVDPNPLFPVQPLMVTYHPLADRLSAAAAPGGALVKRLTYLEAEAVVCPPGEGPLVAARFGLDPRRCIERPERGRVRAAGGRRVLVVAHDEDAEVSVLARLKGKRHVATVEPEVVVALPLGPAASDAGMRVTIARPGVTPRAWETAVEGDALGAAASLLASADLVVLTGDAAPAAFAISRWTDNGIKVVFGSAPDGVDLSPWRHAILVQGDATTKVQAALDYLGTA